MGMASKENFGLMTKTFLPSPEKELGLIPKMVRGTREILVGWAEDIPVLNWGTDLARRII